MKQLDPRAVWLFFVGRGLPFLIPLSPFIIGYISLLTRESRFTPTVPELALVTIWFLGPVVVLLPVLFIWAKLHYKFYGYELREDGFRKERGIIWKKYVTIPYDRIQNVDIYRGPVTRMLGLSDLRIQTAGASSGGLISEGRLPGLSRKTAEELRDELVKRAKEAKM